MEGTLTQADSARDLDHASHELHKPKQSLDFSTTYSGIDDEMSRASVIIILTCLQLVLALNHATAIIS
jgi:hypothetical protein